CWSMISETQTVYGRRSRCHGRSCRPQRSNHARSRRAKAFTPSVRARELDAVQALEFCGLAARKPLDAMKRALAAGLELMLQHERPDHQRHPEIGIDHEPILDHGAAFDRLELPLAIDELEIALLGQRDRADIVRRVGFEPFDALQRLAKAEHAPFHARVDDRRAVRRGLEVIARLVDARDPAEAAVLVVDQHGENVFGTGIEARLGDELVAASVPRHVERAELGRARAERRADQRDGCRATCSRRSFHRRTDPLIVLRTSVQRFRIPRSRSRNCSRTSSFSSSTRCSKRSSTSRRSSSTRSVTLSRTTAAKSGTPTGASTVPLTLSGTLSPACRAISGSDCSCSPSTNVPTRSKSSSFVSRFTVPLPSIVRKPNEAFRSRFVRIASCTTPVAETIENGVSRGPVRLGGDCRSNTARARTSSYHRSIPRYAPSRSVNATSPSRSRRI